MQIVWKLEMIVANAVEVDCPDLLLYAVWGIFFIVYRGLVTLKLRG